MTQGNILLEKLHTDMCLQMLRHKHLLTVDQQVSMTYVELGLKSCPPSFTVLLLQLLNGTNES